MKTSDFLCKTKDWRRGYALLLGLLITVVIGMIIYFKLMYGAVYEIGSGKSDINPPWRQWHNMQGRIYRNEIGSPDEYQPALTRPLQVQAKTVQGDKEQGQIIVVILPDGSVKGSWNGAFNINKDVDFQVIMCRFKGLVDPQQIYSDEEGKDPTKLFFIAKGHFMILETNNKSGRVRKLEGDTYARGWMDVNYVIDGELIITSDNKNFYRYKWQGEATEADPFLLNETVDPASFLKSLP